MSPTAVGSMSAPHFRVVYPANFRGQKHSALRGYVYVTWPDRDEEELLRGVRMIQTTEAADDAFEIQVTFVGSCEIQYQDEETP
jgi:hypothetical protein